MLIQFETPEGPIQEDITGKPLLHILDLVSKNVQGVKILPCSDGPATTRLIRKPGTVPSKT